MSAPNRPAGRSPLLFIFLTVFIDLLGFGIVIPLLPVYSQYFGASEWELGLLFSCFSGMQFLFAPLWGRLSDRIGRRPVLIGGLVGSALSYLLFAQAQSMAMLFASRLLAGFFGANISSAQAYIADVTTPENRAKGMGLLGAAFGLGFTFGPLLGGLLSGVHSDPNQLPPYPGYAAAALSLSAALFGYLTLREPTRQPGSGRVFSLDQVREAWQEPRIGWMIALNFLNIFAFACFEAMFTRYGLALFPAAFGQTGSIEHATREELLKAAPIAGYYLFGIGIVSALIQGGFIRRLVPRYGETLLACVGPLLLAIAMAGIGSAPSWTVVLCACLLMPFGFGLSNPSVNSLVSRAAPLERQGAFLGLNQSVASLARMSGPPLAGLAFALGPRWPFWMAATVLLLAWALARAYHRRYASSFPRSNAA